MRGYGTLDEVAWNWVDDFGDAVAHAKVTAFEEPFRMLLRVHT